MRADDARLDEWVRNLRTEGIDIDKDGYWLYVCKIGGKEVDCESNGFGMRSGKIGVRFKPKVSEKP